MKSSLFDAGFYLRVNPDIAAAVSGDAAAAQAHFEAIGRFEGRAPSPFFDPQLYLAANPDVAAALAKGTIPSAFDHFQLFGVAENRRASAFFDPERYLEHNPDVEMAVRLGVVPSAYDHFIQFGMAEARESSVLFDATFYLAANPDVAQAVASGTVASALQHFMLFGRAEHRETSPFFDLAGYLEASPDVADAVARGTTDPYTHFLVYGFHEGRDLGNGISLAQFSADPLAQAAIAAGDVGALLARIAAVAPFMPTFSPPAGFELPADLRLPTDFVPTAGLTLTVPAGMVLPAGTVLPPAFEVTHAPPPGGHDEMAVPVAPQPPSPPAPIPHPQPEPGPSPHPELQPDPIPAPHPQPDPDPGQEPSPTPEPQPDPAPEPHPQPDPIPEPGPSPHPEPQPDPFPAPQPQPEPVLKPNTPVSAIDLSLALSTDEDSSGIHLFQQAPVVIDPDEGARITATLRLADSTSGTLHCASGSFDAETGVLTLSGSPDDVGALLRAVTFTPTPDWAGATDVSITLTDGVSGEVSGSITIDVAPVNDAVTVSGLTQTLGLTEDAVATRLFTVDPIVADPDASDVITAVLTVSDIRAGILDGDHLKPGDIAGRYVVTGSVQEVNAALAAVTFKPHVDFDGPVDVDLSVSDGISTAGGKVSITITGVNDAPVAEDDASRTSFGTALTLSSDDLLGNDRDADGDRLSISQVAAGEHGTVALGNHGAVVFTPDSGFAGTASFSYRAVDGHGGEDWATVSVTVAPENLPPQIGQHDLTTDEDTPLRISIADLLSGDHDPENGTLSFIGVSSGSYGEATLDDTGSFIVFTPAANRNGPADFYYTVADDNGSRTTGSVLIDVRPVNDAPTVSSLVSSYRDAPGLRFAPFSVADVDGDDETAITLSVSTGRVTWQNSEDYEGIVEVGGNDSAALTLRGSVAELNYILGDAVFVYGHDGPLNSAALLTATVCDADDPTLSSLFSAEILPFDPLPV